jgi:hypothetical protein
MFFRIERLESNWFPVPHRSAGTLVQSMGARNRGRIVLSYGSLESIPGPLQRLKSCALNSDLAFMITTNLTFILQSSLKNEFMGRDG